MYDSDTRKRTLELVGQGRSLNAVSKQTGISRSTIREWQARTEPPRCSERPPPKDTTAYAYLLGLYLGDGCISAYPRGVRRLRIFCADAWPGLIDACTTAMRRVLPGVAVSQVQKTGCVEVGSYSKGWPDFFPQHGPGKKHDRRIVLEPWQQAIVDDHPWELIRGLIHSDGCRVTNWATRLVGGERKRYEYPRYFFTNKSEDILRIYSDALDSVGVAWTATRRGSGSVNVSVARRASVALMDAHVGAKC